MHALPGEKIIKDWRKDFHAIEKYKFLHHFLPHPQNKSRAKLLSTKALFVYSLFLLFTFGVFRIVPKLFPGVLGYASDINVRTLYDLSNKKRESVGLGKLTLNEELSAAALEKAQHMFKNNYWAHVAPDGTEPWDFILAEGYDYAYAGENLAKNFKYSKEVVEAWYSSPSHRDNLMNANYTEVGYAVVNGVLEGYETTLVVQMFGKSRVPTHLASSNEEERILESMEVASVPAAEETLVEKEAVGVLPALDVTTATRSINVVFGGFLVSLLGLDLWYSRRHGIAKITGHTFAHLMFLIVAIAGMWLALSPGKVL